MSKKGLVYGWGVNDVDYLVRHRTELPKVGGRRKQNITWTCPYFIKWKEMLKRCFDKTLHKKAKCYIGCTVCEDWKYLSNFIKWVDSQPERDWESKQLDKDLLVIGNKHYGPETCVFLPQNINGFLITKEVTPESTMIGCNWLPKLKKFQSRCRNPFTKKDEYLGLFEKEIDAHFAWKRKKYEYALIYASREKDPRVVAALVSRYML